MLTSAIAYVLVAPKESFSDPRYLQLSSYRPSMDNPAIPTSNSGKFRLIANKVANGVRLTIANGTNSEPSIAFNEVSIDAFLQAKKNGKWQAIQLRGGRGGCGSGKKSTIFPAKHEWSHTIAIPAGSFKTLVRFCLSVDGKDLFSNTVELKIPQTRFRLSPEAQSKFTAISRGGAAQYVPYKLAKRDINVLRKEGWEVIED